MLTDNLIVPGSAARILKPEQCRPETKELYALWNRLRANRTMPARRDFSPTQARRLLPHILLIDVLPNTPRDRRFRIRLHGTEQVRYQGADWTGAYVHEKTDAHSAARLCAVGDYVVTTHKPWISTGNLYWLPEKRYRHFESILLPMSDDDSTVNMILGLTIFF